MASGDRLQIADKPTLDEINTTIGDTGDTGGSSTEGSLMAKLNEILEQLGISTTGSTVQEVLEELLNQPKIIRHIQRGVSTFTQTNINIQLSGFTNAEKMIAIIDGGALDNGTIYPPYISSLTESNLAVSVKVHNKYNNFSYQVIEFA